MRRIQILGPGCDICRKLADDADAAAKALGIKYTLEKVTDTAQIMQFDVLMTPALAVDGVVKVSGKVPDIETLKQLLAGS